MPSIKSLSRSEDCHSVRLPNPPGRRAEWFKLVGDLPEGICVPE